MERLRIYEAGEPKRWQANHTIHRYKPDGLYDVVTSIGRIQYVKDLEAYADSLRALLKPDGVLYVEAPRNRIVRRGELWRFDRAGLELLFPECTVDGSWWTWRVQTDRSAS